MYIFQGFDFDNDGQNDVYIGRQLSPQEQREIGAMMGAVFGIVILLIVLGVVAALLMQAWDFFGVGRGLDGIGTTLSGLSTLSWIIVLLSIIDIFFTLFALAVTKKIGFAVAVFMILTALFILPFTLYYGASLLPFIGLKPLDAAVLLIGAGALLATWLWLSPQLRTNNATAEAKADSASIGQASGPSASEMLDDRSHRERARMSSRKSAQGLESKRGKALRSTRIEMDCPNCGNSLRFLGDSLSPTVRCSRCRKRIQLSVGLAPTDEIGDAAYPYSDDL